MQIKNRPVHLLHLFAAFIWAAIILGIYLNYIQYPGLQAFSRSPFGYVVLVILPALLFITWETVSLLLDIKTKKVVDADELEN